MQTVPCEYCGNPINVSAIEIHRKICSKRPGAPQPIAVTPKPIAVTPPQVIVPQPGAKTNEVAKDAQIPAVVNVPVKPANGVNEVFMPLSDPYFMVSEYIMETLRITEQMSHRKPTNLLITGQPGGGKTSLALQFAAKFNRPCVVADFGVMQEPQQLFQTTRLSKVGDVVVTDTQESGFVKGIETEGCVAGSAV